MKIFLAGAVSTAKEKQLAKYEAYKNILISQIENLILTTPDDIWDYRNECENQNPDFQKIQIDEMMVKFDLAKVRESDLIVCDLSELSTGMGLELGVAHEGNQKIMFFYEKGSYISNMITGAFPSASFIQYDNMTELKNKLKSEIENFIR